MDIKVESQHVLSPSAMVIYWMSPATVVVYYFIASTISFCVLQKPSQNAASKPRRFALAALVAAVTLLFVAQGVVYILSAITTPGWWAPQTLVTYILLSVLVWGGLSISLIDTAKPIWHPYLGAWLFGLAFEIVLLFTTTPLDSRVLTDIITAILSLRVLSILILCIVCIWLITEGIKPKEEATVQEDRPLLAECPDANVPKPPNYGAAPATVRDDADDDEDDDGSDEDEPPEHLKEAKEQQRKRLQERGSYLAFLSDFKILIPLVWPSRNLKVQLCLLFTLVNLLAGRVWNVLIPRQLGLLTNALTESAGTGEVPYQPLLLWMLFTYLSSSAGISLLASMAELPAQQYAYKTIGTVAFNHVMSLSMDFHNDKNSGEIIAGVSQGQRLYGLLQYMIFQIGPTFLDLAVAVIYVTTLFDSNMALIVIITGICFVYVGTKVTRWSAKGRRKYNTAYREQSKVLNESMSNWQTVSHFNRATYECTKFEKTVDDYNKADWYFTYCWTVGDALQSLISVLGQLAAAFLASYRVSQGAAPVGSFVTLMAYWSSIEGPMHSVAFSVRSVSNMLIDSERLLQLLRTKPTVFDAPDAKPLHITNGAVEFKNVDFAYDPRKTTLKNVSFKVDGGQTIALVGETGGGKSTILKILYRYYDVTSGSVTIDGQDIRKVTLNSLRDAFGMVPQDPSLFNLTIMENIRYARLDATDDEVYQACKAAAIHDKIMTFPDGYKSKVGERGVKLSGGELQRTAIARAILRNPPIVLLDEATSMIDAETEAVIQQAFKKLTADRTTFVVAHRLSTIQNADLILVIQDGEVIERGTHGELFAQKGKYTSLWSRQLSKETAES